MAIPAEARVSDSKGLCAVGRIRQKARKKSFVGLCPAGPPQSGRPVPAPLKKVFKI